MGKVRKVWLQWFRHDADLYEHPKTIELANCANWHREIAVARLSRLWSWVARHAPTGTVSGLQASGLEQHMRDAQFEYAHQLHRRACLVSGDGHFVWEKDEDPFENAGMQDEAAPHGCLWPFVRAGFLEPGDPGSYVVHDWDSMNGRQLRERLRDHNRPGAPTAQDRRKNPASTETETETDTPQHRDRATHGSVPTSATTYEIQLPTNVKGSFFGVSASDIEGWRGLYPAVDVLQELRKMVGWLDANPTKRKTQRGMRAFVNRWLAKEQDKGGSANGAPAAESTPESREEQVERWKREGIL